jgi:hypothetical protein
VSIVIQTDVGVDVVADNTFHIAMSPPTAPHNHHEQDTNRRAALSATTSTNMNPCEIEQTLSRTPHEAPDVAPQRSSASAGRRGRHGINTRNYTCCRCRRDYPPHDNDVAANNDPLAPSADDRIRRLSAGLRVRTVGDKPALTR